MHNAKYALPANTETYEYHSLVNFFMKESLWTNETVSVSGTPLVLDPSVKKTLSGTKNPVWTFGTTSPEKKFTLSINSEETRFFQLYYRKFNSSYTIAFFPIKTRQDYTIYLDFAAEK